MAKQVEVFQDLAIQGPVIRRPELRNAMVAAATSPWHADVERAAELARRAGVSEDVLLFRRDATNHHPAAGLTLWGTDDGYYVPNIVPLETGKLTFAQYNSILADFVERVAAPVVGRFGFTIIETEPRQSIDDWLPPEVAMKLRRFSGAANKSTASNHPADERRWFDFIVAAHHARGNVSTDRLARWLNEVEGWDEESAHELAGDFERSLELLTYYDKHKH
jgi:hypothetical protein